MDCGVAQASIRQERQAVKVALRARDLRPGSLYYSPTGKLCMLLAASESGLSRAAYLFAYVTRSGKPSVDEGFAISANNDTAIAAMREANEAPKK
jgi:hypothetical protein